MKISTRVALLLVAAMLTAPLARAQSDGFYRIRNVNEATNKDYVKMTSNVFNYTTIVGSASSTAKDPAPAIERAKKYFKFDVGLTTNVLSDPGTIFYLKINITYIVKAPICMPFQKVLTMGIIQEQLTSVASTRLLRSRLTARTLPTLI